jgi:hypothetical protein
MKIRQGFVSNSSSSSFVICRAMVKDNEIFDKVKEAAERANKEDYSGETYLTIDKNYVHGDISYHDENFFTTLEALGVTSGMYSTGD